MKKYNKKYILVTYEFGSPVFIAPLNGRLSGVNVTSAQLHAEVWDESDASNPHKLDYHKIITGYKQLQFKEVK